MIKKFLFASLFFISPSYTAAETCPTPSSLQHGNFAGWQALDIDNAEPLSLKHLQAFEKKVHYFAIAEWMQDAPEGEAHCYYDGIKRDYSHLGVFLTRHGLSVDKTNSIWQRVDDYVVQCNKSISQCFFIDH